MEYEFKIKVNKERRGNREIVKAWAPLGMLENVTEFTHKGINHWATFYKKDGTVYDSFFSTIKDCTKTTYNQIEDGTASENEKKYILGLAKMVRHYVEVEQGDMANGQPFNI